MTVPEGLPDPVRLQDMVETDDLSIIPGPTLTTPSLDPLDVVVKIVGGHALPESIELQLSIEPDGRVVMVTDRSVYSSVDDFTAMRLTGAGLDEVRSLLAGSGVLDLRPTMFEGGGYAGRDEAYVSIEIGDVVVARMNRYGADAYEGDDPEQRAIVNDVVEVLSDLSWLAEGSVAESLGPWVPDTIYLTAHPGLNEQRGPDQVGPIPDWPLDAGIEAMADGTTTNAYDEPVLWLCLWGQEVAPVFDLLTGVNHAYLRVLVDGQPWELNVTPEYPAATMQNCE